MRAKDGEGGRWWDWWEGEEEEEVEVRRRGSMYWSFFCLSLSLSSKYTNKITIEGVIVVFSIIWIRYYFISNRLDVPIYPASLCALVGYLRFHWLM